MATVGSFIFTEKMEIFISFLEGKRRLYNSCRPGKYLEVVSDVDV